MGEPADNLNSSMSSGSEGHKSSSAGDALKKPKEDVNHTSSNSTSHKNHTSGSPLKKTSHSSSNSHHSNSISKSKDHHNSPKHKDPNAIKKPNHDSSKVKDGHRPKDGSSKPKIISNSSSPKPKPKDGSHSSSKPKDGSHSSSKPKDGSHSSSKTKEGSHSSSKPKEGSHSSKPKEGSHSSSKHKEGSHSSSKPKEGSHSSKPKEGSHSSKPKEGSHSSSKPKEGSHSSSKPKDGSHSSSKHSSSSKSKDGSQGTPKLKPSSGSKPKVSSSGDSSKHSSSHKSSSSSHKDGSSKSKDASVKPNDSSHKSKDPSQKHKDPSGKPRDPSVKQKHSSSSSSKHHSSSSKVIKTEPTSPSKSNQELGSVDVKPKVEKLEMSPVKQENELSPKVKLEKELSPKVKQEKESTEKAVKKRPLDEDDDDEPLSTKSEKSKKQKLEDKKKVKEEAKRRKKEVEESDEDEPLVKKKKDKKDKGKKDKDEEKDKKKKKKKKEEEQEVWKWWEEEPLPDGMKWRFLEHKGPVFAPPYEPLPDNVQFKYDGKVMKLSEGAEEVAGFYARMLDHDYTTKEVFNTNFFNDWRKEMTPKEQSIIENLDKCNFKQMHKYYMAKAEERRNMPKEEKQKIKKQNEEMAEEYGFCIMDNHREKIGNFKIEPPGLFRGRGDHPKMGKLKKRIMPEDVIINSSKDAKVPDPPEGHKWKKVIHDNKVSWLSTWTENIQGQNKYIMLNPSSRLKGEKDWQKYETARKLKKIIGKIRENYREDFKSKEMRVRQRAVAMYFIDKLALRAGNEKEEGETADTVGCCSLRVEHIKLHDEMDGKEFVVEFDFLGKDSIRYQNAVPVEKRVFKNLKLFIENKAGSDDLFDRLNTSILNEHLRSLMEHLTAKVFRTYNASFTLQNQLSELTNDDDSVVAKELAYNRANRAVAILCNHQRAAPKTFDKQMANLQEKIDKKHDDIKKAKKEYKALKADYKSSRNERVRDALERKKKQVERLEDQLMKLDVKATDKQENKEIALGTSKLNYLDPRISVAWCKKFEVPIEKIYNKTQREKFRWAIDMAGPDFVF